MYDRILVPTDGSDHANLAAQEAFALAKQFDASLYVVYVIDSAALPGGMDASYVTESLEEAGEDATAAIADRARDTGVEVGDTAVVYGTPHSAILEYADENDVDLIVMATHGRSGIERYLLGSVTEKVVRTADQSVMTVRPAEAAHE